MDITITSKETKRKVFVSNYDDGVFINIMSDWFRAYTSLDKEETLQLIEALKATLNEKAPT